MDSFGFGFYMYFWFMVGVWDKSFFFLLIPLLSCYSSASMLVASFYETVY